MEPKSSEELNSQGVEKEDLKEKITFDSFVSGLEDHVKSLYENNSEPTFEGAMSNFLTSILNKLSKEGGLSVDIRDNKIFIHQHPGAGSYEKVISLDKENYQKE